MQLDKHKVKEFYWNVLLWKLLVIQFHDISLAQYKINRCGSIGKIDYPNLLSEVSNQLELLVDGYVDDEESFCKLFYKQPRNLMNSMQILAFQLNEYIFCITNICFISYSQSNIINLKVFRLFITIYGNDMEPENVS